MCSVMFILYGEMLFGYVCVMFNLSVEVCVRLGMGNVVDVKLWIGVLEDFVGGWLLDLMCCYGVV